MECNIEQQALANELTFLSPALKDRLVRTPTVHLTVADDRLSLATFNGDLNLRTSTPVTAASPGAACAKGSGVRALVAMLPKGPVRLTTADDRLHLAWETGTASYPGMTPWLLRPLPSDVRIDITVPTKDLAQMLAAAAFAIQENYDPRIPGVLIEIEAQTLRVAATDGHSMAIVERAQSTPLASTSLLLPFVAVPAIRSLLLGDGDTRLVVAGDDLQVTCGARELQTRAASGKFPDWRRIVPTVSGRCATLHAKDLLETIQRVVGTGDDLFEQVELALATDQVTVTSAQSHDTLSCLYAGDPFTVKFDGKKLRALLATVTEDRVSLFTENPLHPQLFQPASHGQCRMILVPIRKS